MSLGQMTFAGIGAAVSAWAIVDRSLDPVVAMVLAAVCGDPAVDRRSGFERRLQLAKAANDRIEAYGAAPPPLLAVPDGSAYAVPAWRESAPLDAPLANAPASILPSRPMSKMPERSE